MSDIFEMSHDEFEAHLGRLHSAKQEGLLSADAVDEWEHERDSWLDDLIANIDVSLRARPSGGLSDE